MRSRVVVSVLAAAWMGCESRRSANSSIDASESSTREPMGIEALNRPRSSKAEMNAVRPVASEEVLTGFLWEAMRAQSARPGWTGPIYGAVLAFERPSGPGTFVDADVIRAYRLEKGTTEITPVADVSAECRDNCSWIVVRELASVVYGHAVFRLHGSFTAGRRALGALEVSRITAGADGGVVFAPFFRPYDI